MWSRCLYKICLVFVFLLPLSASAGISISEIMYDVPGSDSGREWIEFENTDTLPIDIAGWKLYEAGVHHKIIPRAGTLVPAGGYAVIASNSEKFLADWPHYSGILFQSSFSLKNTGETMALKNASSSQMASSAYAGGSAEGDGNSLNAVNGVWAARKPSPGQAVSDEVTPPAPVKSATKSGNAKASPKVSTVDGAAYDGVVAITDEESLAAAGLTESGKGQSFAMLPWIAALVAIIGIAGAAVFLKGKKRPKSGYTIIEEKS